MKNSPYYEIDVARLLRAMLHRMWAILLAGFIFAGAGFAADFSYKKADFFA